MERLIVVLLGFALFGALFGAAYFQPREVERELPSPDFRLGPGEMAPDFIEPAGQGANITVNVTVLRGGPIDVYLMNMENLTLKALNATTYTFNLSTNVSYDERYSRTNVTDSYNFTFVADGENRSALLIGSRMAENDSRPAEDNVTAVSVHMRYVDTEQRSLAIAALLVSPAVLLVAYVTYRRYTRGGPPRRR